MSKLSSLPVDWSTARIGSVAEVIDPHPSHRAPEEDPDGIPFAGIGDLDELGNVRANKVRKVSPEVYEEHRERYVITGNTIGFGRVASIGKVIDFKGFYTKVTVSPTLAVIEPTKIDKGFLVHALRSEGTQSQINFFLTGSTRSSLGIALLRDLVVPFPPLPEQQKIAAILSSVDDVIEKTRAQIDKLKDLKTGMMQELLTKGIGHTEFKDSPVGRIPASWEVKLLSTLTDRIGDGLHATPQYADASEFRFINGNNLKDGEIILDDKARYVPESEYLKHSKELTSKTILMSINGTIGNLAFYQGEQVILGKSAAYISLAEGVSEKFIYFALQSTAVKRFYDIELTGSTINNLSLRSIRSTPIALPPREEQVRIASLLSSLDTVVRAKNVALAERVQLKKALMQDLLTGKVRVKLDNNKPEAASTQAAESIQEQQYDHA